MPLLTFSFYYSFLREGKLLRVVHVGCRMVSFLNFSFLALFYALFLRSFAYRARFVICTYT